MTGGTPKINNTKYTFYKGQLSPEEISLIITYAKALKNKDDTAETLRAQVLEIIDKIRPKHVHDGKEIPLRVRGYEILRDYIKIRFTCCRCRKSVYLRIPISANMRSKCRRHKPAVLKLESNVVYISRTDYETVRKYILSLKQKKVDPEIRSRAFTIINHIRPHTALGNARRAMAVSSYRLYSEAIAIKFRDKRLRTARTIYLKPLPNDAKPQEQRRTAVLAELHRVLSEYLAKKHRGNVDDGLKRKLRSLIEQIRPKHRHNSKISRLHVHGYYRTKSGDIVIRFYCPKCGKTESIRLPGNGKGKSELELKDKFVISAKNVRCIACGSPAVKNGSARTKIRNLRIQQYKCTNPHCRRQFRATVFFKAQISQLFELFKQKCEVCEGYLKAVLRRKKVVLTCEKCHFEKTVNRKVPVFREFIDNDRRIRLLLFILADAVALIFSEIHHLPFEFVESVGYAARKYISGLSYANYSALLHSPAPLTVLHDSPCSSKLFRAINRLEPDIVRSLVNFSAKLAYGLLSKAINIGWDASPLYVVDSTVQIIAGPYVPEGSNIRFHLAVSLPFLVIDDALFGDARHEFHLHEGAVGEIADREYATREYVGEALRSSIITVIRPRGEASKFDLLIVNKYLFDLFGCFYYFRWVVEPVIGFVSRYSNKAASRLPRTVMVEVYIRCFVWNVFLIGLILDVLSRRLRRGLFDILFDFWDESMRHLFRSSIKLYKTSYYSSCLESESCVLGCGISHPRITAS